MSYSLILRNQNIIADYSETEGDFQQVAMKILKTLKHSPNNSQNSIVVNYEQFDFNILIEDSFTFVCLTKSDSSNDLMEIFRSQQDIRVSNGNQAKVQGIIPT